MPKFSSIDNPGLRFTTGRVGNPVGRPPSIDRLRKDIVRELVKHGAPLAKMCVQKALAGDAACLAACFQLLNAAATASDEKPPKPEEPVVKT